jgi:hypothetical protein
MSHFLLKLIGIAVFSAIAAVAYLFRDAFRKGEDPSDDGPRALIANFLGLWTAMGLFIWSFTIQNRVSEWTLRVVALAAGIAGTVASDHFASTTEVPETPDVEPTGFKNSTTRLHLED